MHTRASFDAGKDERTHINADAKYCDRSSKQPTEQVTRARGKFKNLLSRNEPDSELGADEETARTEHSYTSPSNINTRGEDARESNTEQADKSRGAAYRA